MLLRFCSVFAVLVFAGSAFAQDAWQPSGGAPFDLNHVVVGKSTTENGRRAAQFLVPEMREEMRTEVVNVTKIIEEHRTRTVIDRGIPRQVEYVVQVPVVEQVERVVRVMVPKGSKRVTVNIEEIRAWDKAGFEVTGDDLYDQLRTPKHVLVLESSTAKLDPYYTAMLRDDALFVYSARLIPAAGSSAAPPRPAGPNLAAHLTAVLGEVNTLPLGECAPIPAGLFRNLPAEALAGRYKKHPTREYPETNEYHEGAIRLAGTKDGRAAFEWRNAADVAWRLTADFPNGRLNCAADSPYFDDGAHDFILIPKQDAEGRYLPELAGFYYNGAFYRLEESPPVPRRP